VTAKFRDEFFACSLTKFVPSPAEETSSGRHYDEFTPINSVHVLALADGRPLAFPRCQTMQALLNEFPGGERFMTHSP
jgi:hypothetical protein